jgi:hypothetical protein
MHIYVGESKKFVGFMVERYVAVSTLESAINGPQTCMDSATTLQSMRAKTIDIL